MHNYLKGNSTAFASLAACAALGGVCFAPGAVAQHKAAYSLATTERDVAAENRVRSVNWTRIGASLPTGFDAQLKSGLYAGAWGTGFKPYQFTASDNTLPVLDVYAGFRSEISKKLWVDVGVGAGLQAVGPAGSAAFRLGQPQVPNSTQELYAALSWGQFTAKYSRNTANLFGLATGNVTTGTVANQYLDLSANFDLGNGYSLSPRLGRQDVPVAGVLRFTDYSLTLGKTFSNGLSLSVSALGTQAGQSLYLLPGSEFTGRVGLAAGLKYAF